MCLLSTAGSLDVSVTKEKHTLGNRGEQHLFISFFFFLHSYTMIFTNLVTFHMMRFSEPSIAFRSVTNPLE